VRIALLKKFAENNKDKSKVAELWHNFLDTAVVAETLNLYKEASNREADRLKGDLKDSKIENLATQGKQLLHILDNFGGLV
jgi:hypothetical protein